MSSFLLNIDLNANVLISNVRETTLVPAAEKDECGKEDADTKDSDDSDEDLDSPWQIHQVPEASSTPRAENVVEDMEVTTDG